MVGGQGRQFGPSNRKLKWNERFPVADIPFFLYDSSRPFCFE